MARGPASDDSPRATAERQQGPSMNANSVAKNYASLRPEERFRLIFAASGRGDEAERDRLANGDHIALRMPAHAPYGHAFQELSFMVFIELLEAAARYLDAVGLVND